MGNTLLPAANPNPLSKETKARWDSEGFSSDSFTPAEKRARSSYRNLTLISDLLPLVFAGSAAAYVKGPIFARASAAGVAGVGALFVADLLQTRGQGEIRRYLNANQSFLTWEELKR